MTDKRESVLGKTPEHYGLVVSEQPLYTVTAVAYWFSTSPSKPTIGFLWSRYHNTNRKQLRPNTTKAICTHDNASDIGYTDHF
ncbi:hypothetical protein JTE90_003968 [Oedothorax gibbosus]|uniref:Uncharacterized protein n=1 Tax=Oedothorax gibbosus TaxID=931172 RepID=A0AAV6UWF4_9ARAC|nr:hypothetical protein JTE90_003968 [Oedothorax gibbosus]